MASPAQGGPAGVLSLATPPRASWATIWAFALTLVVVVTILVETAWRAFDYRASATDSPPLWKFWYEHAASGTAETLVFIGSSRIEAGIATSTVRERLPGYRVVQLGIQSLGGSVGVLQMFADDQRFHGVIVCDALDPFFARAYWDNQLLYYRSEVGGWDRFEAIASARVHERLAIFNRKTGTAAALKRLAERGRLPAVDGTALFADRSIALDFTVVDDLESAKATRLEGYRKRYQEVPFPEPGELYKDVSHVEELVNRIQNRGGHVVFVRMPSSAGRLALEEQYHPKSRYWNRFVAHTSATCIHFADMEEIAGITCPDDSHLDYEDAKRFSVALIDRLRQAGVLPRPAGP